MNQKLKCDRNIGCNLRRIRKQHGLSQEKLCNELRQRGHNIGRTTYQKYESGELNIRISILSELQKIYECTYDDFFENI